MELKKRFALAVCILAQYQGSTLSMWRGASLLRIPLLRAHMPSAVIAVQQRAIYYTPSPEDDKIQQEYAKLKQAYINLCELILKKKSLECDTKKSEQQAMSFGAAGCSILMLSTLELPIPDITSLGILGLGCATFKALMSSYHYYLACACTTEAERIATEYNTELLPRYHALVKHDRFSDATVNPIKLHAIYEIRKVTNEQYLCMHCAYSDTDTISVCPCNPKALKIKQSSQYTIVYKDEDINQ